MSKIDLLLEKFSQTYSEELEIDLKSKDPKELFKWFLASILFGGRISETIAKNTYKTFERHELLDPKKILSAGRSFLINPIMREGKYVRYDGLMSTQCLRNCERLLEKYSGNLNLLHDRAKDSRDLENKLLEFYRIGPVTVNIFLRELRAIWPKANPKISKFVKLAAKNLDIDLSRFNKKTDKFVHLEAALLRLGKNYCHKKKCDKCPSGDVCNTNRIIK